MSKHDHKHSPFTHCGQPDHTMGPNRREFLYAGLLGGLGLTLPQFLKLQAAQAEQKDYALREPVATSVIQIFLPGGMSAQETLDPKPYAPVEYRGPMGSIDTNVTGVKFGELMRETAQIADKMTVIRSMTHGEAAHERGTHNMFTGYRPSPALTYPSMGAVVSHEMGPNGELPPYVCVPNVPNEHAGTGYLSSAYGAFALGSAPEREDFQVRDLSLPDDIDHQRFARRQQMLEAVDAQFVQIKAGFSVDNQLGHHLTDNRSHLETMGGKTKGVIGVVGVYAFANDRQVVRHIGFQPGPHPVDRSGFHDREKLHHITCTHGHFGVVEAGPVVVSVSKPFRATADQDGAILELLKGQGSGGSSDHRTKKWSKPLGNHQHWRFGN